MITSAPILVTGVAGFIGFHLANRLLRDGHSVIGVDSLTSYYSTKLKKDRLAQLDHPNFQFIHLDLADHDAVAQRQERICLYRLIDRELTKSKPTNVSV